MKKIIALLMAMSLLLCSAYAMAEETVTVQQATADFDVTAVVPEGYTMQQTRLDGTVYLDFSPDEENAAEYLISIAFNEEMDGMTLNEMSEEERQALLDLLDDDFEQPELHEMTTESGTQVYMLNEGVADTDDADTAFAVGITVYKGYMFQIYAMRGDFDMLSQEDLDLGMRILSDIWFVE